MCSTALPWASQSLPLFAATHRLCNATNIASGLPQGLLHWAAAYRRVPGKEQDAAVRCGRPTGWLHLGDTWGRRWASLLATNWTGCAWTTYGDMPRLPTDLLPFTCLAGVLTSETQQRRLQKWASGCSSTSRRLSPAGMRRAPSARWCGMRERAGCGGWDEWRACVGAPQWNLLTPATICTFCGKGNPHVCTCAVPGGHLADFVELPKQLADTGTGRY